MHLVCVSINWIISRRFTFTFEDDNVWSWADCMSYLFVNMPEVFVQPIFQGSLRNVSFAICFLMENLFAFCELEKWTFFAFSHSYLKNKLACTWNSFLNAMLASLFNEHASQNVSFVLSSYPTRTVCCWRRIFEPFAFCLCLFAFSKKLACTLNYFHAELFSAPTQRWLHCSHFCLHTTIQNYALFIRLKCKSLQPYLLVETYAQSINLINQYNIVQRQHNFYQSWHELLKKKKKP